MLAQAISDENPEKAVFTERGRDIAEDQEVLQALVAWVAEKMARLKLGASADPLSNLQFLEALTPGVQGKLYLWKSIESLPESYPAHDGLDLPKDQLDHIEHRQLESFARVCKLEFVGRRGPRDFPRKFSIPSAISVNH